MANFVLLPLAVLSFVIVSFGEPQDIDLVIRKKADPKSEKILLVKMPRNVYNSMDSKRSTYMNQIKYGLYDDALPKIDKLIKEKEAAGLEDETSQNEMLLLRLDKTTVLIRAKRKVEALIEAMKTRRHTNAENIRRINDMINKKFQFTDYEFLQLPETANLSDVKKAYKKIALLVHPDKHQHMTEVEERFISTLFGKIRDAFDNLRRKLQ